MPVSVRMKKNRALGFNLRCGTHPATSGRTQNLGHNFFPIRTDQGRGQLTYIKRLLRTYIVAGELFEGHW